MICRVYTDGACTKDRCGGWSAIFYSHDGTIIYSGGDVDTTNNRMELKAIIEALRAILRADVKYFELTSLYLNVGYEIYSDSAYCVNGIRNRWYEGWKKNGWRNAKGESVKNPDLWQELSDLLDDADKSEVDVFVLKVKGHSGIFGNDVADLVAKSESLKAGEASIWNERWECSQ